MLRIAVVDNEVSERNAVKECLSFVESKRNTSFLITEYESAEIFLFQYEHQFDIVLMDIDMESNMDGMTAAKKLRILDQTVILIFITNLAQMAVNGYMVDALDFIVKPLDKYSFLLRMSRALSRIYISGQSSLMLKNHGDFVRINPQMIQYLEVKGHYIIYHCRDGEYEEYITLASAEAKLNDPTFFRCSRGLLVNLRMITGISRDICYVDGVGLPIARTQKKEFLSAYEHYLSGCLK